VKLICLNIWGGKIHDKLLDFIKEKAIDTDIFCFQENFSSPIFKLLTFDTRSNIHEEICKILPQFQFFYYPTLVGEELRKSVNFPLSHGQVTFVRKDLKVLSSGEIYVYREKNKMGPRYEGGEPDFPKNFIYTKIEANGKPFLVLNIHGFWNKARKTDTPQRFKQSQIILDFIEKESLPVVLAGDFNLRIENKSLTMLEDAGLRNLVKEYNFPTTRSSLYDIKWLRVDPFADYIFTKGVLVKDFKVLNDEISDHLPLYLDFIL